MNGVPGSDLLAAPQPSIAEMQQQLPLMGELHDDTVVLWEQFQIQPDHLMVDGLPRILVWVDDADGRCDEILSAVDRPDLVMFVLWSEDDYATLFDSASPPWRTLIEHDVEYSVDDDEGRLWESIGTGLYGITHLRLRADQEQLAATLLDRYGELIEIDVGNFAFPADRVPPAERNRCGALPYAAPVADVTVDAMTLDGDVYAGQIEVIVTNRGATTVHLVPDRVAELTEPGSTELVTQFAGAMSDEDRGSTELAAGAATTIVAQTSWASCDLGIGYSLPAGSYEFVLPIQVFDSPASENDVSDHILLPRLRIELPDATG